MSVDHLEDFRVDDVSTFLAVQQHGSIRNAASKLGVTPSQISKAIARLERYLRITLFARQSRGLVLTDAGKTATPRLRSLLDEIRALQKQRARTTALTVCAPSFLSHYFIPRIAKAIPDFRVRGLQQSSSYVQAFAGENIFQIALTLGEQKLPAPWISMEALPLRQSLFSSPRVVKTLGKKPTEDSLRKVPFVLPVYQRDGRFFPGEDGCAMPLSNRTPGHEASTASVAAELAAECDQLVYLPEIVARPLVQANRLVDLNLEAYIKQDALFVAVNSDEVLLRTHRAILHELKNS